MGKIYLISRLAARDLRRRPADAILLLLAIATAATALTLGMALQGATDNPYAATRAATKGPDVVAIQSPANTGHADTAAVARLEHASGVVAHTGPYPMTWAQLRAPGLTAAAEIEGRSTGPSPVDQPRLTSGRWVGPGDAVVEASFAQALGLHPGDRITLGGAAFQVTGTAVTAAIPNYPRLCSIGCDMPGSLGSYNPGLVWLTKADAERVAKLAAEPVAYVADLQLENPAQANAFTNTRDASSSLSAPYLVSWQTVRDQDAKTLANEQIVLLTASWLLGLLALACVAVLVGGRIARQTRRVGLLKAIGGTPGVIAAVLLAENVVLALCAAGAGLLAGRLAAPLLTRPGAGLLGAPGAPSLSVSTAGLAVAMALGVAVVATFGPAIRAGRLSTVSALNDASRPPKRRGPAAALSAHLPVPLLLGARLAARRPRRILLAALSVAVTTSGIVAVLVVHVTGNDQGFLTPGDPQNVALDRVTTLVSAMLIVLAAVNAIFIALATALEARHSSALVRALGATRGQVDAALAVAQAFPALAGALLGIPGGIGLYDVAKNGGGTTVPSVWWLAVMVIATVAAVAVLTVIPARIGARRPVAETLQA